MIGHVAVAHGAEEDGVEGFELGEAISGDVVAVLFVVGGGPGEVAEFEGEGLIEGAGEGFEDEEAGGEYFGADAVAGDGSDGVVVLGVDG